VSAFLLEARVKKRNADKANGVSMQKKYENPHAGYHPSRASKIFMSRMVSISTPGNLLSVFKNGIRF
jgi:hypothetical protein